MYHSNSLSIHAENRGLNWTTAYLAALHSKRRKLYRSDDDDARQGFMAGRHSQAQPGSSSSREPGDCRDGVSEGAANNLRTAHRLVWRMNGAFVPWACL
jgi:hypothetical protein